MKKITLKTPNIKLNKKIVLITAGAVVVLAIISFGIVRSEQAKAVQRVEQAKVQEEAKLTLKTNTERIQALEATATQSKTDAVALCSWIDGMVAQRRVLSPPLCSKY